MNKITFTYKADDYSITTRRENIGTRAAFDSPDWIITAVNQQNELYANIRIKDSVLRYILQTNGKSAEIFLAELAENEIKLHADQ